LERRGPAELRMAGLEWSRSSPYSTLVVWNITP
jgi:hypothetical protein